MSKKLPNALNPKDTLNNQKEKKLNPSQLFSHQSLTPPPPGVHPLQGVSVAARRRQLRMELLQTLRGACFLLQMKITSSVWTEQVQAAIGGGGASVFSKD